MADDNNNNLPVPIDGGDRAFIGTDVFLYGGQTAHAQVMKVAWGDFDVVNRATTNTPLPVQVYGITGSIPRISVTGTVSGLGRFSVVSTKTDPVYVTGGVNSYIYGITGAPPVAVTGSVSILGSVGITGAVSVTGGRYLSASTDTVTVTGGVGRSWNLTNVNDNIRIYSHSGATTIPATLFSSNGSAIGSSGDALNVNIVGAGISANVSISSSIGVFNYQDTILRVQGTANGTPIPTTISGTPKVSLRTDGYLNESLYPLFVDARPTGLTIASLPNSLNAANNLEKLFIANNPRTPGGAGTLHTSAQWLSFLWDAIGEKNSVEGGTIQKKLLDLSNGTSKVTTKVDINFLGAGIQKYTLTPFISPLVNATFMISSVGYMYINNSSHDILLTSNIFLVNALPSPCALVSTAECITAGIRLTTELELTEAAYNTYVKNGGYLLKAGTTVFLPMKFDRYFLAPADGDLEATGILTVISA